MQMHLSYLALFSLLAYIHIVSADDEAHLDITDTSSNPILNLSIPTVAFDLDMSAHRGGGKYKNPSMPLDIEGYPVAPPELELEQVHIYVRHGERTPVSIRMADPPASIVEHWTMCNHTRNFRAAVSEFQPAEGSIDPVSALGTPSMTQHHRDVQRVVEHGDGVAREAECLLGQLTDVGRESTYNYGYALRKLYIDRLGFLPDTLSRQNDVYFRSTNIPRTIESLQQIIHGLYPVTNCSPGLIPQLRIRNGRDENLLGNTLACARLGALLMNFAHAAAAAYNPILESLDKKVSKYLGGNPIRIDGKPRASGVLDTIRASIAHGVRIPPEFEEKNVVDTIEKAVVNEWFAGYKTEEVRRLGMGRLLGDLSSKMQLRAQELNSSSSTRNEASPRILVHSTHDTAIAALTSTLDVFDNKWPAFTASVTFELFRRDPSVNAHDAEHAPAHNHEYSDAVQPPQNQGVLQTMLGAPFRLRRPKNASEFYVRTRYQNRNLVLPLCADEGKHLPGSPEFCSLAAFAERVDELVPKNWEAECAVQS